ncbi:MAG: hypothetical protein Q9160_006469 [Pyrenula sp. 1 TL-2023]
MASFVQDLWSSVFTPGPTPTLLVATNATFAALQLLFLALLLATYSVHFAVLSFLCAGLWWSINWFATELQAAKVHEEEERQSRVRKRESKSPEKEKLPDESDTETEVSPPSKTKASVPSRYSGMLQPENAEDPVRKRRSLENSGYISTDSEWEKVDESDEKTK